MTEKRGKFVGIALFFMISLMMVAPVANQVQEVVSMYSWDWPGGEAAKAMMGMIIFAFIAGIVIGALKLVLTDEKR